jgi:hypothetical protein
MENLYIYRSKNNGYSPIDSLSFYILNALNFAIEKKSYSDVKILYECLEIYQDNLRKYPDEPNLKLVWDDGGANFYKIEHLKKQLLSPVEGTHKPIFVVEKRDEWGKEIETKIFKPLGLFWARYPEFIDINDFKPNDYLIINGIMYKLIGKYNIYAGKHGSPKYIIDLENYKTKEIVKYCLPNRLYNCRICFNFQKVDISYYKSKNTVIIQKWWRKKFKLT